MNNKSCFLALNRIPSIGPRTVLKLLKRWPILQELFAMPATQMEAAGLPARLACLIAAFDFKELETDLKWEQLSVNHHLLTWEHPLYPALLREIHDPPIVLYATGNLSCLQQKTLAIVGTRRPSVSGSETAYRFAFELASAGITIVSGLAMGIDAQAHAGCIAAKGQTIAVMGTGIDRIYPAQHARLAAEIQVNGLLVTEFPIKSVPASGHFPRRNRIISGLSMSTLVIEAAIKSGSLITARMALEQNRDVLAVPGSIYNPQARGCHQLLQQGAKLITSGHEILQDLGIDCQTTSIDDTLPSPAGSANLVKSLGFEVTGIDKLSERSGLTVNEVACNLAELELQGVVRAVPGGYVRCAYERRSV